MDNSIYISLSRQLALFRDMSATANNIANANTTGYLSEHMLFNSYLTKDINQRVQNDMAFANDIATYHNMENGAIKATGNKLDVAIASDGFFAVQTPLGTRYTRAGSFKIDEFGTLVTPDGNPVLSDNGQPILLPENAKEIIIGEAGNISVDGADLVSIGVYKFDNPQLLERLAGAMFKSEIEPELEGEQRVVQGALSGANVKPVLELTHMMDVSNSVSNTAKFIEVIYDLERKTSNTWAQMSQ
ncbi:MAG: flagellar hook-basal body complex protein [Rickettsiales bacterium]